MVRKTCATRQSFDHHCAKSYSFFYVQRRWYALPFGILKPNTVLDRIVSIIGDPARNCFYTLSGRNTVSVYQPAGPKKINHIQTLSNLLKLAQDKVPTSAALTAHPFQIIALHPIDPAESQSDIQLLAITTNGTRLYFSASGFQSAGSVRSLQLHHVRLPPPNLLHPDQQEHPSRPPVVAFGASQAQPQPQSQYVVSSLDSSCYTEGLTIAAQQGDTDGTDFLLCMAPDLTRIGSLEQLNPPPQQTSHSGYGHNFVGSNRPPLTEYATLLSIPGRTWAMAPFPRSTTVAGSHRITNELALQFSQPPRQFMILTNVGLTFLIKRRALDYLKAVIEELQSEGNVQPIIDFRDR